MICQVTSHATGGPTGKRTIAGLSMYAYTLTFHIPRCRHISGQSPLQFTDDMLLVALDTNDGIPTAPPRKRLGPRTLQLMRHAVGTTN